MVRILCQQFSQVERIELGGSILAVSIYVHFEYFQLSSFCLDYLSCNPVNPTRKSLFMLAPAPLFRAYARERVSFSRGLFVIGERSSD